MDRRDGPAAAGGRAPRRAQPLRLRITCTAPDREAEEAWDAFLAGILRQAETGDGS